MDTFIWNGKKAQSLRGKNDDSIMALSIALLVYEPAGNSKNKQTYSASDWHNAFLQSISRGSKPKEFQQAINNERESLRNEILGLPRNFPSRGIGMFGIDPRKLR